MRPNFSGTNVVLLLVTTLSKFQIFATIIAHFSTHIMRYAWDHCEQAEDMVRIAPFCWGYQMYLSFAIHEAVQAVQYFFHLSSSTFHFAEFDAKN